MIRRSRGEVITPALEAEIMTSPLFLPFVTEGEYARWAGVRQETLYGAERVKGPAPVAFPEPEPDFYDLSPLQYDFPAVTRTTLSDVAVRGRSNLVTLPDGIVRHGLINMAADVPPEEFYARLSIAPDRGSAAWVATDPFNVAYLPEAAVFVDGVAFNYAHWLTEVLPRIAAFVREPGRAAIPLLVDADLHANILRSISLVAGPDVTIHRLAPDQLVRVGLLHNISVTGYVPFKLRRQAEEPVCHGLFGGQALSEMVGKLRLASGVGDARPKLLIRRNSSMRHMVNEDEIEQALTAQGFVVVEPERLTLEEQVAAFSSARMIVGATGAAIANLVFCRADCPTVVLMPKFRETAYWYWRRMAAAAGAGPVVHVSGEQVSRTEDPYHPLAVHQDFRVEVGDVLAAVAAAADALSG